MSTSKSKSTSSNTATTYDQRTTETINAGIGGDIEDSTVVSGVRGNVNLHTTTTDHGAINAASNIAKNAIYFAGDTVRDAFDFGTDALDFGTDALDFGTDALESADRARERSFDFGETALSGALEFGADVLGQQSELVEQVLAANAEQQSEVLNSANRLTELSLANLAAIKSGETIAKAADRNLVELKNGVIAIAGLTAAAVIGSKILGGKR